jgi:LPXTG-motif cell wall-anchored protein
MMTQWIFGAIGLLFIIVGLIVHRRKRQDILYVIGGFFLLVHSVRLGDIVFIMLQCVFILVAGYGMFFEKE